MASSPYRRPAPNAGKGRPPGIPNKTTRAAREAFQFAFDGMGGAEALRDWGKANPGEFYKLYARLIPVDHTGGIVGDFTISTGVPRLATAGATGA